MKICTYCDTKYELKEIECPSCGSNVYNIECDVCHAIHSEDICPNCGNGSVKILKNCPKCGHQTSERICPSCGNDSMLTTSVKESVASVFAVGACKLTGHKFVGCKCTRCGKTRDTGHDYKPVANKCKKECSICGNTVEIPHIWKNGTCTRCGARKKFIEKSLDTFGEKYPFLHLENPSIRYLIQTLAILLLILVLFPMLGGNDSKPDSNGRILLPSIIRNYKDENFEDAVHELKDDGFTNVSTVALGDLILGWLNKEGEIASVKVGGVTKFESSGRYATDVEIVIEYHSFPKDKNGQTTSKTYVYTGQQYEIVDSYKTGIGLTQYWVYTSTFDYSTEEYKQKIKEIITDLVRTSKTTDIIVEIVTDKEIVYFESDNTIAEYMNKYGMKYFTDTIIPKEKTHWIASYTGGYDSGASQLSKADSAYELIWFIGSDDPKFVQWKPDLIQ